MLLLDMVDKLYKQKLKRVEEKIQNGIKYSIYRK